MGQNLVASASLSVRFCAISCFFFERMSLRSMSRSCALMTCTSLLGAAAGALAVWAPAIAAHANRVPATIVATGRFVINILLSSARICREAPQLVAVARVHRARNLSAQDLAP